MSSQLLMSGMAIAEFLLWAMLGFLFWKKRLHTRFPAMSVYLAMRVLSAPVLLATFNLYESHPSDPTCFMLYFFPYWAVYLTGAVLLFFVCIEVFRTALMAFPGLMKVGIVLFRWAILVSVIVTFSSVPFWHRGMLAIPELASSLMRSVSVLELCLLAFLCLSMNALRLTVRDIAFGIALGFGLMSANDFLLASLTSSYASLTAPLQIGYEVVMLGALGLWGCYFALPEPVRKPVVMPASSAIYRWNEIASALGHTGTQVAVQQPAAANSFFLTDVEKVVEKVLRNNLKRRESES